MWVVSWSFAYRSLVFLSCVLFVWGGLSRPVSASEEGEIGAGQIFLESRSGSNLNALHLESKADITISGIIAHVVVTQRFKNQTDDWQEATYVMPLSETAAVNAMEMIIGERIVKAEIREKQEARKIYQQAKAAGKKAALTEQSRANLFRQTVANIAPGEIITVKLKFVQSVDYDHGEFSLRFPMTLTPRFIPGQATPDAGDAQHAFVPGVKGWSSPTNEVPDANLITPFMKNPSSAWTDSGIINPITIQVSLDPGLPLHEIGSPYHNVSVSRLDERYQVTLIEGVVSMDRDFVLNWKPTIGNAPKAAVFREHIAGEDYVMLMMLPPEERHTIRALPRDMVFVIDTSGSMKGTSIQQAKSSLQKAVLSLRQEDRFNIIAFNSTWSRLFSDLQTVNPHSMQQAKQWVSSLSAGGGTNMLPALSVALEAREERQLRHVVFITDGAVGNESALFGLINSKLGETRLFPVAIGSAPNSFFMRQAANFGRGTFTHIGDLNEVADKMAALYQKIDRPIVTNIAIQWPREVEYYPRRLPSLYQGEPLLVVAKAPDLAGEVHVTGDTAASNWRQSLSIDTRYSEPGVGSLWGRRKIATLEEEKVRGGDPEKIKSEIIDVALTHHLVSAHTSLVAVEEIVSRLPEDSLKSSSVPNALPKGQTAMYPKTATSATLTFLVGCIAVIVAFLLTIPDRIRHSTCAV
jgi:Ca-activated chloride channel family protein